VLAGTVTRDEALKWADSAAYVDEQLRVRGLAVPTGERRGSAPPPRG